MVDLSLIQSYLPILSFLLVFTIVFAVFAKYKILGESKPIQAIVGLVLSLIFISVVEVRGYVEAVTNVVPPPPPFDANEAVVAYDALIGDAIWVAGLNTSVLRFAIVKFLLLNTIVGLLLR